MVIYATAVVSESVPESLAQPTTKDSQDPAQIRISANWHLRRKSHSLFGLAGVTSCQVCGYSPSRQHVPASVSMLIPFDLSCYIQVKFWILHLHRTAIMKVNAPLITDLSPQSRKRCGRRLRKVRCVIVGCLLRQSRGRDSAQTKKHQKIRGTNRLQGGRSSEPA